MGLPAGHWRGLPDDHPGRQAGWETDLCRHLQSLEEDEEGEEEEEEEGGEDGEDEESSGDEEDGEDGEDGEGGEDEDSGSEASSLDSLELPDPLLEEVLVTDKAYAEHTDEFIARATQKGDDAMLKNVPQKKHPR